MFVPHRLVSGETLAVLSYQGTWNASGNAPTLTSGTGTRGHLYRVDTAGSTTIDGVVSWAVNEYLVYNGDIWLRGKRADRHEAAICDLLALAVADDYGKEPSQRLLSDARDGWIGLQAEFVRVDAAEFDPGVVVMSTRRYGGVLT
jgi:hypothetical protein